MTEFHNLTRALCAFATGVVADDNERLFARIAEELPLTLLRYRSGDSFNGWLVPQNWRGEKSRNPPARPPLFYRPPPTPRLPPPAPTFFRAIGTPGPQTPLLTKP